MKRQQAWRYELPGGMFVYWSPWRGLQSNARGFARELRRMIGKRYWALDGEELRAVVERVLRTRGLEPEQSAA